MKSLLLSAVLFFGLLFDNLNIFYYLIISSIAHESGHIISNFFIGNGGTLVFSIYGIKYKINQISPIRKFFVLISGPFINLILIMFTLSSLEYSFTLKKYIFLSVNMLLMFFNLLPISFLDGGQIVAIFFNCYKIEILLNILSLIIIGVTIIFLSANIYYSLIAFIIFLIYYTCNLVNPV